MAWNQLMSSGWAGAAAVMSTCARSRPDLLRIAAPIVESSVL